MLDLENRIPERSDASFGQALPFSMNNSTEDTQVASGSDKGTVGDPVTACLDSKRQKIVPIGDYYYADACTLCLCSNAEFMCKQISCAPPEKCDGYLKKEPMHCCDVCVPAVVVERPSDSSGLNMKLGALTVALFLVVSLVLFTLHRMRRKRLMVTVRRLQSLRRHNSTCSHGADADMRRNSIVAAEGEMFSPPDLRIFVASDQAAIISRGPPPYSAAVTLPMAPESLAWAPPRSAPAEPPPAYNQAVPDAATMRRSASVTGHSSVGLGRRSRTSDYPDETDDIEARSSSASSTTSSSSMSSLSSSQDSLNAIDDESLTVDDYCYSCSHCDSGLSEERCSLSSNDVRPRSQLFPPNSSCYQLVLGQPAAQQLLPQAAPQSQSSSAGDRGDDRRRQSRQHNNSGENAEGQRQSGGKLCKKKLKKLMMKAKRKAERGRKNQRDEGTSGNCFTSATLTRDRVVENSPRGTDPCSSNYPGPSSSACASDNADGDTLPVSSV